MNPAFRNLFMKWLTRERVVPIISASVSWLVFPISGSGRLSFPKLKWASWLLTGSGCCPFQYANAVFLILSDADEFYWERGYRGRHVWLLILSATHPLFQVIVKLFGEFVQKL